MVIFTCGNQQRWGNAWPGRCKVISLGEDFSAAIVQGGGLKVVVVLWR